MRILSTPHAFTTVKCLPPPRLQHAGHRLPPLTAPLLRYPTAFPPSPRPTLLLQGLVQVAQGYRERGPAALAWLYVLLAGSDILCDVFLSMRVRRLSIAIRALAPSR